MMNLEGYIKRWLSYKFIIINTEMCQCGDSRERKIHNRVKWVVPLCV